METNIWMKDRVILIEKAANEFQHLTRTKDRANRYSKDKNYKTNVRKAVKVAEKYGIKQDFFIELVASKHC